MSIDLKTEWGWSNEFLAEEQRKDNDLDTVLNWMTVNSRPNFKNIRSSTSNLKHYWALFGELTVVDNCLFRRCEDDLNHLYLQLIVPPGLQQRVLEAMHDMPHGGGHMGADRTANRLKKRYYWPKWKSDVERHCLTCAICDRRKCPSKLPKAPLVPSNELCPMQRIEVDVLGGLPTTYDRNRYVLVACDMQAWPMMSQTAEETARILYDNWLTVHGVPDRIHTDQGGNFESVLFKELVKLVGSTKSRTTAFHPAGNGGVERNNRTIIAMLINYVQKDPKSWDRSLSSLCATYNASKHEMTGFSPHFLLTGRELRIPADLLSGCSVVELRHNSVLDLQERMRPVHEVVKERLNQKRNLMKKRYDKSASLHQYNVGDSVLLRDVVLHENEKQKFHLPYRGPYKVIEVCAPNYVIANEDRSFVKRVHFNRLKPSFGDYSRERHAQPPTPVNDQFPPVGFYVQ